MLMVPVSWVVSAAGEMLYSGGAVCEEFAGPWKCASVTVEVMPAIVMLYRTLVLPLIWCRTHVPRAVLAVVAGGISD